MAIESIVVLAVAIAFLVGLAWYVSRHRSENASKQKGALAATKSVTALKGLVRKPVSPVTIEAMNQTIATHVVKLK